MDPQANQYGYSHANGQAANVYKRRNAIFNEVRQAILKVVFKHGRRFGVKRAVNYCYMTHLTAGRLHRIYFYSNNFKQKMRAGSHPRTHT